METIYLTHHQRDTVFNVKPCVIALGFFDGVHLGHQRVIKTAKTVAEENKVELAIITFYPHPKEILNGGKENFCYITPMSVKVETFARLGVNKLYVINFNEEFAALSPESFIEHYVIGLQAVHVVAGFDFTYGFKGKGTMKTILEHGKGYFQVSKVAKTDCDGQKISSTLIREALARGEVEKLCSYLGNYYETRGKMVVNSSQRNIGELKALVKIEKGYTLPKIGCYMIEASIGHHTYYGYAYICPTEAASNELRIEFNSFQQIDNQMQLKIKWLKRIATVTEFDTVPFSDRFIQSAFF
ncbi:FAD synthetase family protein [Halalkalibacterium ligniniphilum]|uniref:FAD synthetase family protein n=1 Tax=Halalkalibacterium ligniniphilum TaxID=1134413 RepID=UPI00034D97F7|nr:FAD synthetase family protein [Halalkalibacterium ligniniphilum]